MEKILLNQNKHWQNIKYENVFYREILILTGVRRAGKSLIFKLLVNHLSDKINPKKILFINCEDPNFFTCTAR